MKKYIVAFVFLLAISGVSRLLAQVPDTATYRNKQLPAAEKTFRVALLAPMYLDSVFTGNKLRSQTAIPNFTIAGIDFIQGAQLALDTINLNGKHVQAYLFDSKSLREPVSWLISKEKLKNMDLLIGSVKEPEYSLLAQFAALNHIPFISATYPNDGNIRNNPYLLIVNSTLKSHCEGIFSYLLQKHGTDNIYLVKKKNDNRIDNYFREINYTDGKALLKIHTIMLDSSITASGLRYLVDTSKPIVIIGASLNETFAQKLADACYPIQKTNPLVFIGMPNWDGFRSWYKKDAYTDFPIRYTSPHYDVKNNLLGAYLNNTYLDTYRTRPSDMAAKGFEITYQFVSLLLEHPGDLMQHINDTTFSALHDFNFRPVYHNSNTLAPDYFENKHLFIMQILNGQISREW